MTLATLRLNKQADRRLRAGHLWIYSNEVDTRSTPLKAFAPGDQVVVETSAGKPLGIAYVNPNTLICGRLVSRQLDRPLDKSLLVHRLKIALSLREQVFAKPYYRLVYGDSDGLPGLVVDRFGEVLAVQLATAGMERLKEPVIAALQQVLRPRAIILRNDSKMRTLEGLESYVEVVQGELDEWTPLEENGVRFVAPLWHGQKTGWFYDHRMNRARMQHYAKGKRVLDLFSYVGGWGIQAAAAGAERVLCVDASQNALQGVAENARLNGRQDTVATLHSDAFEALKQLLAERERFDLIILDPPAFIQRRKDIKNGELAYQRLNQLALRLLSKEGWLVSASCSMHLARERLVDIVRGAARHVDRQAQLVEQGGQGPDHPIHPAIAETEYLKSLLVRVLPA